MVKTVLEIDLVGYSRIARILQQNQSARAVTELNRQVQEFIDHGLKAVGAARPDVVAKTTGDGAILLLDAPDHAHQLARTVHAAAHAHNTARDEPSAMRHFRAGAATGEIDCCPCPVGGMDIAGVTIANAVRLETAARPGELLVEAATYAGLAGKHKREYTPEEIVTGKWDEVFRARRCRAYPPSPDLPPDPPPASPARPAPGDRRAVLKLLDQLYPETDLEVLILLLNMPISHQPSKFLTYAERKLAVVRWAGAAPGIGMATLESELRYLCEKGA